ncbi:MAG: acyltransferase family protein [Burkholderiales bacterium]|nr:acyltransferase [Burkholderiales bacterium]MDQ3195066.1 acyltransferase family protein [Pseudomonadota bacterium]
MGKIRGLDSIRFVCALFVVIYHIGAAPIFGDSPDGLARVLTGLLREMFNGPAAVIVFFVISGFCIHYPHRNGAPVLLGAFYTRRLLRIGLPMLIVMWASEYAGVQREVMQHGIVWSLIAEIIYYLIYPLLLILQRRFGWQRLIVVAFAIAWSLALALPDSGTQAFETLAEPGDYAAYGSALNWLIGLPCWLLGCLLAERSDALPSTYTANIWFFRLGIIAASYAAVILRWHLPGVSISYPWSLNVFAILAYFWLRREIVFSRRHAPLASLEWAGTWSYSLYLTHLPCALIAGKVLATVGTGHAITDNLATLAAALLGAYLCFLVIERPAHRLAAGISARLRNRALGAQTGFVHSRL